MLQVNQPLPNFALSATQGDFIWENEQHKNWIFYFYPKDNTPGCTTQGQHFRDHYLTFQNMGINIAGISRDSLKSHQNFSEKMQFPFTLMSDKDEVLCQLFDVIKNKKMYGKDVRGIERSAFLIQGGKLIHEWRKVKASENVQEILDWLVKNPL